MWEKYSQIAEILGENELNEAIVRAMSHDELAPILEYICRMYEIYVD